MKPNILKLQGFTGIIKGLGRDELFLDLTTIPAEKQLVTLVGPNGSGKSTILDNLHPYRVMPSKAPKLGPGGFSYWDHISGPTASKELQWAHNGRLFKSVFAFTRTAKTQNAKYYLYEWSTLNEEWVKASTAEGSTSDGRAETYDACVDSVVGAPERFFTSQFAAQQRTTLSSYDPSDVKSLLASILNLKLFTGLSAKAAQVSKLLQLHLGTLQEELSKSRSAETSIETINENLRLHEFKIAQSNTYLEAAERDLQSAKLAAAALRQRQEADAKTIEDLTFLQGQISKVKADSSNHQHRLTQQANTDRARLNAEIERSNQQIRNSQAALNKATLDLARLKSSLEQKGAIEAAVKRLPVLRAEVQSLEAELLAEQTKLGELRQARNSLTALQIRMEKLQESGKSNAANVIKLKLAASLIEEVPCRNSQLQSSCKLLAQANQANAEVPSQESALSALRQQYRSIKDEADVLTVKVAAATETETRIEKLSKLIREKNRELEAAAMIVGRSDAILELERQLPIVEESIAAFKASIEEATLSAEAVAKQLLKIEADYRTEVEADRQSVNAQLAKLNDRLSSLGTPVSQSDMDASEAAIRSAQNYLERLRGASQALTNEKVTLLSSVEVLKNIIASTEKSKEQYLRIQDEIAKWKLIEKGMGNNGMVALSIDDAGPAISALCNELLAEDYSGRFKVRLNTQRETQSGNVRETFEIMVFDSEKGGPETPIARVSGGERLWVNECLTRAIALHISQTSDIAYQTLFTDEADGALDPDRKRQFMQMKRHVLKRGNYEREYFISQTPELWELADHIIYMKDL